MGALVALVVVVAGQRLVVPVGPIDLPVPLITGYALLVALSVGGELSYSRVRLELFLVAAGGALACGWIAGLTGTPADQSAGSVLLMLVSYLPWVFCTSRIPRLYEAFVLLMCACAVAALGQLGFQWAFHRPCPDPFRLLPGALVNHGYNTENPVRWGSELLKPTAFVFLEPSFLSQFLALAIVIALLVRAPLWQPVLLGLGLAAALSGTGLVLLAFGTLALLVLAPGAIGWKHVAAGIAGLALVFSTPAAGLLLDRRSETTQPGTSGYARFVQPYTETARGLARAPQRYAVGAGPGAADRQLESQRTGGAPVVYPVVPKLAFEYGLPVALALAAFLLTALLRSGASPGLGATLGVLVFVLSGSLIQPHTTMLAWILGALYVREQAPGEDGGEDLGEREPVGGARRA